MAVVRSRLGSFHLAGIVARRPPLLREFFNAGANGWLLYATLRHFRWKSIRGLLFAWFHDAILTGFIQHRGNSLEVPGPARYVLGVRPPTRSRPSHESPCPGARAGPGYCPASRRADVGCSSAPGEATAVESAAHPSSSFSLGHEFHTAIRQ